MSKSNRVLDLYQALQNGQVINKKEAAEQFCVNEKSIQRDLDSIRDFLLRADNEPRTYPKCGV